MTRVGSVNSDSGVVRDGANSLYPSPDTRYRVCHLLKNPTELRGSISSLVDCLVREHNLGRTFLFRVALRSYAVLNKLPTFSDLPLYATSQVEEALLRSSIVNLSKCDIVPNASPEQVRNWARNNRDEWLGQLQDLRPHVILCGGTFRAACEALEATSQVKTSRSGMKYIRLDGVPDATILDVCHPSARYPLAMVHTHLMETCRELQLGPPSGE